MADFGPHPWFGAALGLVEPRRNDRALLLCAASAHHARALAAQVGPKGSLLVVEPDRSLAEKIADAKAPQVEVLAMMPGGDERFGAFDVMVCCPLGLPRWPLQHWGTLARANLRPGGRLVVDLPGTEFSPDLAACLAELAEPMDLAPLRGPAEEDLAQSLRQAGLRRVTAALGVHLLALGTPQDLVDLLAAPLGLSLKAGAELGRALAHRLQTTATTEVVIHRTRVSAMR